MSRFQFRAILVGMTGVVIFALSGCATEAQPGITDIRTISSTPLKPTTTPSLTKATTPSTTPKTTVKSTTAPPSTTTTTAKPTTTSAAKQPEVPVETRPVAIWVEATGEGEKRCPAGIITVPNGSSIGQNGTQISLRQSPRDAQTVLSFDTLSGRPLFAFSNAIVLSHPDEGNSPGTPIRIDSSAIGKSQDFLISPEYLMGKPGAKVVAVNLCIS